MSSTLKNMDVETEIETVWQCLEKAVRRFNESGDKQTLLAPRDKNARRGAAASERAIAHRLAFYLESELRSAGIVDDRSKLVVDCEYNRHGGALKAVAVESQLKGIVEQARSKRLDKPEEDGFYVFSVAPDIVVHQRGDDDRNRLVVEIKKATNREIPEYDALKLELFTRLKNRDEGYGYNFGAWIVAKDDCDPQNRELRIATKYQGGKPATA